jgi:hypothetical protein
MSQVNFDAINDLELGTVYEDILPTPDRRYIYGGLAWPGKRPGYVVLILMDSEEYLDGHKICLLAEYESFSTRDLVRQIGVLDDTFMPDRWIGDQRNDAADKFVKELCNDGDRDRRRSKLMFVYTSMLEMDNFYQYALDEIKRRLDSKRRMLYLKESIVKNYLSEIEAEEISDLKYGDYPAIEALTYAVLTISKSRIRERTQGKTPLTQDRTYNMSHQNKQYTVGARK